MNLKVNEVTKMLLRKGICITDIKQGIKESINKNCSYTFMLGKRKRLLLNWIYSGDKQWSFRGNNSKDTNDYLFSVIELG